MMKFIFFTLLLTVTHTMTDAHAHSKLLMIGGGMRPAEAMRDFVRASGGPQARILVSSWASVSEEGARNIRAELLAGHPASVELLPAFPMKSEDEKRMRILLRSATGIFFAGGDQSRLMHAIQTENLKPFLQEAYRKGVAIGGTSAGTAILSERMITGKGLNEGLGLLPSEIIVDQHFLSRGRFDRLASLVIGNENTYGVGIDEGTALFVVNNRIARVIGQSDVVLLSKNRNTEALVVETHRNHDLFNLFHLKD